MAGNRKKDEELLTRALADFRRAYNYKRKWLNSARQDIEFALGKQWEEKDVKELADMRVKAVTVNKIRPNIFLMTGIESQNRTDIRSFPEGREDSLIAEVSTLLSKNVAKASGLNYKTSQQFEDGLMCGESFLEPYLDYTNDILVGEMKFKKLDYNQVYPEPGYKEYDLSDCKYVCKLTFSLTREELSGLFPEKEEEIGKIGAGKINLDTIGMPERAGVEFQRQDYPIDEESQGIDGDEPTEPRYDLLEYYYKKYVPVYYVIDKKTGRIKQTYDKGQADEFVNLANAQNPDSAEVVKRTLPEIWVCSIVGGTKIDDSRAWFYPRWKNYHFVPFMCYWNSTPVRHEDRDYLVQGIVRGTKDPQERLNKFKTQELRHINQSSNSGWLLEENSWVDEEQAKKLGSAPGVHLAYKKGSPPPQRINPSPLSQGHAQMALEAAQDMKELTGINTDLLAMGEGGQASGRAISLRQRQGLVMVQKIFDNLSQTKWILGRFILTQLGEVYDITRAMRVLGDSFLRQNFQKPVVTVIQDPVTGQQVQQPQIDPATGQPVLEFDAETAAAMVNQVLEDTALGRFDVAVGESATNETVKYGNYLELLEMARTGLPIPPEILIEESTLSQGSKEKIRMAIERQSAVAAASPPAGAGRGR